MNKTFVMLSGIPRSGSQVLSSMLNQHPLIHATTTSPLVDLLEIVDREWHHLSQAMVNRNPAQFGNMTKGLIDGTYAHIDKPVVVDKNRLWPRHGKLMRSVLGTKPKIIGTVRPIPEVIASYFRLIEKNSHKVTFIDEGLNELGMTINTKNRCKIIWERFVIGPHTSLRMGYNSPDVDLCLVDYDSIVNRSQETMDKICNFIGIESTTVELSNMLPMDENDNFHGGIEGLHHVRPVMQRVSPPAEEVIGKDMAKLYTDMRLDFWNR